MLSATCIARRRRMHCRGSDTAPGTAASAVVRRAAGAQGPPRLPQDGGSAPDSVRRRRPHQTARAEHAPAPGARRQQGRPSSSAAAVALEATAAGDARGEVVADAGSPSSEEASVICAVCLEEVLGQRATAAEVEAITLPCSHAFHPGCVLPWLAVQRACPCCRAIVPSPEN